MNYAFDAVGNVLKIKEENHYYPFGLKHHNYNSVNLNFRELNASVHLLGKGGPVFEVQPFEKVDYNYKYNGKEWQDELGLNVYSMVFEIMTLRLEGG